MAHVRDIRGVADSNRSAGLGGKIAMLAWEECRVGGVIAAWITGMGLLLLAYCWFAFGADAPRHSPELVSFAVFGVPLQVAMFLVLNPNNSGNLVGGFSSRVLRLPVSTRVCVAVTLFARMIFVALSTWCVVVTSRMMFPDGPVIGLVGVFVTFYLVAQVFDWLRAPISGLSSLLVLVSAIAVTAFMGSGGFDFSKDAQHFSVNLIRVIALIACAYLIAVPTVHATRVGWHAGVPEIWEWPARASFLWPARQRRFSSPMAAQVWYELRHSAAWLLALMIGIWLVLYTACWLIVDDTPGYRRGPDDPYVTAPVRAALPFVALLLAAAIQGMRARTVRFRNASTSTDYSFLLPLSSAQLAAAYVTATGIPFVIALGAAIIGHFYGTPAIAMVDSGLDVDAISLREAAWILFSRGMLVGLIAWPLVAVKTRIFGWAMGVAFSTGVLTITLYVWTESKNTSMLEVFAVLLMVFFIGLTAGTYARAWSRNLITGKVVVGWAVAWMLTAWLLGYTMWDFEPSRSFLSAVATLIASLAFASLVPLPYIAVVFDVARQRHGVSHPQDVAQHQRATTEQNTGPARAFARIAAAALVLFVAWLGWPARPSYEALWRSKGYPATLAELDAWYKAVPDDENAALDYIAAAKRKDQLDAEFFRPPGRPPLIGAERRDAAITRSSNILVVGDAEVERGERIPPEVWAATETYWEEVSSQIAPTLKEIAKKGDQHSRYPIDFTPGYALILDHLAPLRGLARELHVDALHWTINGDTEKATDSILAIFPIADSLSEEPVLISQLVRTAMQGISFYAVEDLLNRNEFTDTELARLQAAFGDAARTPSGESPLNRALVGESLFFFNAIAWRDANLLGNPGIELATELEVDFLRTPFYALLFPLAAERLAGAQSYGHMLIEPSQATLERFRADWEGDPVWTHEEMQFMAPMASILIPALYRARDAEWRIRTQLSAAQTGFAVERYRLANGRLPDNLDALVPQFIDRIPPDFYADNAPLRYRRHEDGSFVVYGIGFDGEDDMGVEMDRAYFEGDLTFTVSRK